MIIIIFVVIAIPCVLTLWNIATFIEYAIGKENRSSTKFLEIGAILLGLIFTLGYIDLEEIIFVHWSEQLYNDQIHSIILPTTLPTIRTLAATGFISYVWLRFCPIQKQPPLLLALAISGVYIGIVLCVIWCVQTACDAVLILFPANCILIFVKTIYRTIKEQQKWMQEGDIECKKLSKLLNCTTNLPLIGILLFVPLLGVIIGILYVFGQEPNSIIKAWTDTADWNLSQKIAPQNVSYDEHYLCTVAASGHKKVVKPIRPGVRHGHLVIVNRQLCVANAFEEVLAEKMPKTHKIVRRVYDNTGYPIAKHIKSKIVADAIYILMKPLEWFFVIVLYLVDVHPEDRIALQYPHQSKPN